MKNAFNEAELKSGVQQNHLTLLLWSLGHRTSGFCFQNQEWNQDWTRVGERGRLEGFLEEFRFLKAVKKLLCEDCLFSYF